MLTKKLKALRLVTINQGHKILPEETENEEIKRPTFQKNNELPAIIETIYSHRVTSEGN